ncbi:MAG: NAD(P)-dependent oxidoreductase [Novosphingobium sp.]|nr:NAD(P)-dependent oxidoreductase [Novosphingobium sp.]
MTGPAPRDDLQGATVLVAGGRGFIGSHVVRTLVRLGAKPVVFGPPMTADLLEDLAGSIIDVTGSIEDRDALEGVFARYRPRLVLSCVAYGAGRLGLMRTGEAELSRSMAVNVNGFATLLDVAAHAGVTRLVWTSSTVVYGPATAYGPRRVTEDDPTAPVTGYGLTKELAERVAAHCARRGAIEVVGLRLPLVLGPGLWYDGVASAIANVFARVAGGDPASIAFHDQPLDFMAATDAAGAIVAALGHAGSLSGLYNLTGFTASVPDILACLRKAMPSANVSYDRQPTPVLFPLVDGARFSRDTGFRCAHDLRSLVHQLLGTREPAHV